MVAATIALSVTPTHAQAPSSSEFFIVSSVNPPKHQVLVKHPTEVTQVVRVDDHTRYIDRSGKMIALSDLRAGDTVYVTMPSKGDAALEIRKGPMTLAELQRRYLQVKR
ncbi:MAG TPA: hypothetical protein VGH34_18075 [Vicinamibacterales bacterium]